MGALTKALQSLHVPSMCDGDESILVFMEELMLVVVVTMNHDLCLSILAYGHEGTQKSLWQQQSSCQHSKWLKPMVTLTPDLIP